MTASPSTAVPRLFYHLAYWCHSCDMSIGLPPSPTPNALLCPHCHRDSLEQMEMEESVGPSPSAGRNHFSSSSATFTPSDDNFLLSSPYLHRLIHHITTTSTEADPRSDPASRSSIDSLQEVTITTESDPTMLCPVCKDPFVVNSVVKMMPCNHAYHSDCIVPWLEINNSCPLCRCKLPSYEAMTESGGEEYSVSTGLDELVDDDEMDMFGLRNSLMHIARSTRLWNEGLGIGSGGEGNLFSPTQIGEVERGGDGVLERQNSGETVSTVSSSWPRRGGNDGGAFHRS